MISFMLRCASQIWLLILCSDCWRSQENEVQSCHAEQNLALSEVNSILCRLNPAGIHRGDHRTHELRRERVPGDWRIPEHMCRLPAQRAPAPRHGGSAHTEPVLLDWKRPAYRRSAATISLPVF